MLYFADHLGSVSLVTGSGGAVVSRQDFDPWGGIRSGGIRETTLNYTGQRKDGTGLLYYHARYYDPVLARFISADSVVPGAPDGSMDGVALKPLTVDFHEPGFVSGLNAENGQGFWFQHSDQVAPWGPQNPQALNRYAYVQNNPLRYTDPTGHTWYFSQADGAAFASALRRLANSLTKDDLIHGAVSALTTEAAKTLAPGWQDIFAAFASSTLLGLAMGAGSATAIIVTLQMFLNEFADFIDQYNGAKGIAVATDGKGIYVVNRSSGQGIYWDPGYLNMGTWMISRLPSSMYVGAKPVYSAGDKWWSGWHFKTDEKWVSKEDRNR